MVLFMGPTMAIKKERVWFMPYNGTKVSIIKFMNVVGFRKWPEGMVELEVLVVVMLYLRY